MWPKQHSWLWLPALWRWHSKKMYNFQGFCKVMVLMPVMEVDVRCLWLSQNVSATQSWVKYQRMRWNSLTVMTPYQWLAKFFLQIRTWQLQDQRKRQRHLKAPRNYVRRWTVAKSSIGGRGGLDIIKFDELNWFIVLRTSIWGGLVLYLGG